MEWQTHPVSNYTELSEEGLFEFELDVKINHLFWVEHVSVRVVVLLHFVSVEVLLRNYYRANLYEKRFFKSIYVTPVADSQNTCRELGIRRDETVENVSVSSHLILEHRARE